MCFPALALPCLLGLGSDPKHCGCPDRLGYVRALDQVGIDSFGCATDVHYLAMLNAPVAASCAVASVYHMSLSSEVLPLL